MMAVSERVTGELSPDFFSVFEKVHGHNSLSLAEDPAEIHFLFSDKNLFFLDGHAWLATRGHSRLAVFQKPDLLVEGKPAAFWGFWETDGDMEANRHLFEQGGRWAKERGARVLWGPINFSTFGNYRLRLDHFEDQPFYSEPWNPSYYPSLVRDLGYVNKGGYVSYAFDDAGRVREWAGAMDAQALARANGGLRCVSLTQDLWHQKKESLWRATNEIFSENFAFTPIDFTTFDLVFGPAILKKMCPETSVVLIHESGEVAGFCINFPDYTPLLRRAGQASGLYYSQITYSDHGGLLRHPCLLVKTAGVVKKYRNQGFPFLQMVLKVLQRGKGYTTFKLCLMREGNFPSLLMKNLAPEVRHYGLFARDL